MEPFFSPDRSSHKSNNTGAYQISEIVLFTPYYKAGSEVRQAELDECLHRNLQNPNLSKIYLLIDDGYLPTISHPKLANIQISKRPTYRLWLELSSVYANQAVSVLSNSDIYFDSTIASFCSIINNEKHSFISLSRYDLTDGSITIHPNPHWSQDTWAISGSEEIDSNLLRESDFPLGVPRCDNKIAYIFAARGWQLFNPCKQVHSIHLHSSQERNYDKKRDNTLVGAVGYVFPGEELLTPSEIAIDVWARRSNAIRSVSLNKSLDLWLQDTDKSNDSKPSDSTETICEAQIDEQISRPSFSLRHSNGGQLIYKHRQRFFVYKKDNKLIYQDILIPFHEAFFEQNLNASLIQDTYLDPSRLLSAFIPPVINTCPINVHDRPLNPSHLHYWQYPCATEKHAYENHASIARGKNLDNNLKVVHTYLGLPWATYIDNKLIPNLVLSYVRPRISGMRSLAHAHGYRLAVHTVCQHIYWDRLINDFNRLGITDLHLSHLENNTLSLQRKFQLNIHSWPLIAVNFVHNDRAKGFTVGKSVNQKRYLASFVGAYMPHYRSDIRVRLFKTAQNDGGKDLCVVLKDEWHFNKIVYEEQVKKIALQQDFLENHANATVEYNQILSDSVFSLCPEGAGPNTLRVWESMAVGAIPVILSDDWIPPDFNHYGFNLKECFVFFPTKDLDRLFAYLRSVDKETLAKLQANCMKYFELINRNLSFAHAD